MNYSSIAEQIGPRTGATQEWVYRVLRHGIVSGELPGGAQLKQDEISAALNVSHIPVREALRQLEALGLVRIHPNRGASVTQLFPQYAARYDGGARHAFGHGAAQQRAAADGGGL